MTIQTRKLHVIEEIIRIQDENSVKRIELAVFEEIKKQHDKNMKPISLADYDKLIEESVQEHRLGETVDHTSLKKSIKGWK